jgi:hypothetical protein
MSLFILGITKLTFYILNENIFWIIFDIMQEYFYLQLYYYDFL